MNKEGFAIEGGNWKMKIPLALGGKGEELGKKLEKFSGAGCPFRGKNPQRK